MSRVLASTLVFLGCIGTASAQPPPDVDEAEARRQGIARRLVELAVRDLLGEEWVSEARQELALQLAKQLADIDRTCSLTDAQMTKLQLAGRGDIKRLFDRYHQVIRKSQMIECNDQTLQELREEANQVQIPLHFGLFHEDSLMAKSLPNTLTAEQLARYDAMAGERRELRHRINVLNAVIMLNIQLRQEQRQALIALMTRETTSSRKPSQYDSQVLLLQLGRVSQQKLKPLFDQDQWEIMKRMLAKYQQMEPLLKRTSLLPAQDDGLR
jgi:hypothetical protein